MPMVIEIAGSSIEINGRGRGSFTSARVSPIMISGMPATATMSPGRAARVIGSRARPLVSSSSVILTFLTVPSWVHQATCWPLLSSPFLMRSSARRPRNGEASRLVTWACSGISSS